MRKAPANITEMIQGAVETVGYELIGVELLSRQKQGQLLRIYIDSENGINVDDCAKASHQISGVLETEDPIAGEFTLEVSSPGLDRPLFELAQYKPFIGRMVNIIMTEKINGQKKFKGTLQNIEDDLICLEIDHEIIRLAYEKIDRARLVIDF